ncbi:MAG: family 10 glycosylhydrolase [Bacteroidetes bacterium]|nr:family 10 glycosylhydrolase [Bacteroidota bacterium]
MVKMIRFSAWVLIFIWVFVSGSSAQEFGVWIATAHRIDYPKTNGSKNQQAELINLVQTAADRGITTLYFQVRGRGDAVYQSDYEPWSEVLSGKLGQNPGWDPLDLVIKEASKRKLKVVGWFNVYKITDGSNQTKSSSKQKHPVESHPSWVMKSGSERFLNPGIPEVREYLAKIAADLVKKYPLDGLQLDFIRYPTTPFNDKKTVSAFKPKGMETDDWRRKNISETVKQIRDAIKKIRPDIELSAAPLGIWKSIPGAKGLESYKQVYQDSFGWVQDGLVDAIMPQIYWPAGNIPDGTGAKSSPDFNTLTENWVQNCRSVPVIPGIGLYKEPVFKQTDALVRFALKAGAQGVAFYSWSQFVNLDPDFIKLVSGKNFREINQSEGSQAVFNKSPSAGNLESIRISRLTGNSFLLVFDKDARPEGTWSLWSPSEVLMSEGKLGNENSQILPFTDGAAILKLVFSDGTTKDLKIGE